MNRSRTVLDLLAPPPHSPLTTMYPAHRLVLALLVAHPEPLPVARLQQLSGLSTKRVRASLEWLSGADCAFETPEGFSSSFDSRTTYPHLESWD